MSAFDVLLYVIAFAIGIGPALIALTFGLAVIGFVCVVVVETWKDWRRK